MASVRTCLPHPVFINSCLCCYEPLCPGVCVQTNIVSGPHSQHTETSSKVVLHSVHLFIGQPSVISQLQFLEHFTIWLNFILFCQDISGTKQLLFIISNRDNIIYPLINHNNIPLHTPFPNICHGFNFCRFKFRNQFCLCAKCGDVGNLTTKCFIKKFWNNFPPTSVSFSLMVSCGLAKTLLWSLTFCSGLVTME